MKLTVQKGQNRLTWNGLPIPNIPTFGCNKLAYEFKLGDEWWDCDPLTEPGVYGLKLPAKGCYDYQKEGANFAVERDGKNLIMYPRYYKDYVLHSLRGYDMVLKKGVWYSCEILQFSGVVVMLFGTGIGAQTCASIFKDIKFSWFTIQPFLGTSGKAINPNDTGKVPSVATQKLSMEIRFK